MHPGIHLYRLYLKKKKPQHFTAQICPEFLEVDFVLTNSQSVGQFLKCSWVLPVPRLGSLHLGGLCAAASPQRLGRCTNLQPLSQSQVTDYLGFSSDGPPECSRTSLQWRQSPGAGTCTVKCWKSSAHPYTLQI